MRDKHIHISEDSALLRQLHRDVASELSIHGSRTALLLAGKFIFYAGLAGSFYYLIYHSEGDATLILAYLAYGLSCVLLGFNFAHDFSHNTIFKSKTLNNAAYVFIYTLLGAHAEAWKDRHIHSHHYAPNVKDYDTDLQITSLIRVEPGSPKKPFHKYQYLYAPVAYTTYSLYWVFIKDIVIWYHTPGKTFQFHLSFWLQKSAYLAYLLVLPLSFSGHSWIVVALSFLGMHLLQSVFLLFTFFITHHVESTQYFSTDEDGYINTSWIINQVKSSNDFYPFSPLANFVFGGFNNHIAHHLFPHVHHVHYPALSRILYRTLNRHNIQPNATGYLEGVISHLRYLKKMGA